MIKILALDFDGVILESVNIKDQAFFYLFDDATLEERKYALDLHRKNPGINRREKITLLLNNIGRSASQEIVDCLLVRFSKLIWDGLMRCPEVSGVRDFLEGLDIPCYVISAAPQEELLAVANQRNLSRYFVRLLGSPPQKIELLRYIVHYEKVLPQTILFIGDKISDYNAAKEVGTKFIGRRLRKNETVFPSDTRIIDNFKLKQNLFK